MADAKLDSNSRPTILGLSNADGVTPVVPYVDPTTHRLLVDSSGGSGSAGTEYTEGDTDTTITGPAIMWEDTSNTLRAVSAAKPLPVDVISSALSSGAATSSKQDTIIGHVDGIETLLTTIDGRVDGVEGLLTTIDGHVDQIEGYIDGIETDTAAIAASASVLDDWDEFDRAKVNPIAGQAGVQGGSGVVTALTQRVVLATDVALPAGTAAIGKVVPEGSASGTGLSVSKTDALVATATSVKAGSGRVYGYHIYNPNSAIAYVHFYNIASGSVTVGSSIRTITLAVPPLSLIDGLFAIPVTFSTEITVAATTTITGSTAPSTGLLTDVFYI
jgi:hypothetical protein